MAGRPRIHFAGALDHVIARGNHGQKILLETGETALSKLMQGLQFGYARNFNL
jgi:hypothetical protein